MYSKKVEYLHKLVYEALDCIEKKRCLLLHFDKHKSLRHQTPCGSGASSVALLADVLWQFRFGEPNPKLHATGSGSRHQERRRRLTLMTNLMTRRRF